MPSRWSGPAPTAGAPILALAAGLFSVGLAALWWAFVNKHWRNALLSIGAVGVVVAIAMVLVIEAPA